MTRSHRPTHRQEAAPLALRQLGLAAPPQHGMSPLEEQIDG